MVCFIVNNVPKRSLLDYYKASSRSPTLSPSSSKVSSQKPHSCHALVCSVNLSWLFIAWRMEPQIPPDVTQGSWNLPQSFFFPNTLQEPHTLAKSAQLQAWPSSVSLAGLFFLSPTSSCSHSPPGDTPYAPQLARLSCLHRHRVLRFSDNTQPSYALLFNWLFIFQTINK